MSRRGRSRSRYVRSPSARKPSRAQIAALRDDVVLIGVDPDQEHIVLVVGDRIRRNLARRFLAVQFGPEPVG